MLDPTGGHAAGFSGATTTTASNGTYTLGGLPAGSIRIRYIDLTVAHTDEYHINSPDYAGATPLATPLAITPGSPTPGLTAALTPPPEPTHRRSRWAEQRSGAGER